MMMMMMMMMNEQHAANSTRQTPQLLLHRHCALNVARLRCKSARPATRQRLLAMSRADELDYYIPEARELQAAVRPLVTLHPEYDARQLHSIIKGAQARALVCAPPTRDT